MPKLPAFQFYPGDWMKDPNLRRCSHAAKGVWVDALCLMFECDERGVLATDGTAWSDNEIAQAIGGDLNVTLSCISELALKGVANRSENGALYSKRMVRDEHKRRLCSEAGKRGGNPTLKGTSKGSAKGVSKRKPTPSSSTSTSVLDSSIEESNARTRFKPPTVDQVRAYCLERGNKIEAHRFVDYYATRGWKLRSGPMKDWQAAVRTWEANQPAATSRVATQEDAANWNPSGPEAQQ